MTTRSFGVVAFACLIAVMIPVAIAADLTSLGPWKTALSFRPPTTVQKKVKDRGKGWEVHRLEAATGPVNVDIYSVHVSRLPQKSGKEMKPEDVLEHIRLNLNSLADTSVAVFKPFDEKEEKLWSSSDPTGAILLIDMKMMGISPDSGCVVATRRTKNEWVFSTIRSGGVLGPESAGHPVSGNRAFGVYKTGSKYVFYNVAADRPTGALDRIAGKLGVARKAQAQLWKSLQTNVAKFITDNGGEAELGKAEATDYDWDAVKSSEYYDVKGQPNWE